MKIGSFFYEMNGYKGFEYMKCGKIYYGKFRKNIWNKV